MNCEQCREALSSWIDHEAAATGVEPAAVEAHLAGCSACRTFAEGAAQVGRVTRVSPAESVPDLTASIMAELEAELADRPAPHGALTGAGRSGGRPAFAPSRIRSAARSWLGGARLPVAPAGPSWSSAAGVTRNWVRQPAVPAGSAWSSAGSSRLDRTRSPVAPAPTSGIARLGLALVGLAQLALAIPGLLGDDGGAPVHIAREQGSWALALAVALLVVAWRPARAGGILVMVGVLVTCLSVTMTLDIIGGRTVAAAEAPHMLAVLGFGLLWLVAHPNAGSRPRVPTRPAAA